MGMCSTLGPFLNHGEQGGGSTNSFFDLWPDLLVSWVTIRKMGMCGTLGPFLNHGVGVEKFCVDCGLSEGLQKLS
ncbi:hypothetical protein CDAR_536501 [Caerostris darwini]|uniref:Uncharacterized protein n=1 Tax=Caerostris darwini TaxID=1538125 RepID=A0AAV4V246_9ARAC|nr:hypothetical protein CDAR_536501 [Caerostris darwini]